MSSLNPQHHSGAEWVRDATKQEMSPLGVKVADLLGYLFQGIYHISREIGKVDWANPTWIAVNLRKDLATYDFDELTRLVFLAHAFCLRVSIESSSPQTIRLMFHQRQRDGSLYQRHPTLDEAVETFKKHHGDLLELLAS